MKEETDHQLSSSQRALPTLSMTLPLASREVLTLSTVRAWVYESLLQKALQAMCNLHCQLDDETCLGTLIRMLSERRSEVGRPTLTVPRIILWSES